MSNYIDIPSAGSPSWKAPVSTAAALPASGNSLGDARVTQDTSIIYVWSGSAWVAAGGGSGGGVTSVNTLTGALTLVDAGTDGITITSVGTTLTISQHVADGSHNGYLSSTDWTTFNGKQAALTIGNFTDVGTDGIVVTGGTGAVIGSGTSIAQHVSDASHNGYLTSTDWSTFNSKQPAGNYITALTGDATASGPGSVALTISNLAVTNAKIANSTIDLTTKVTGILPAANGGAPPVTRTLYVDGGRTDTYSADGSEARPFKTIGAAVTQVITNADNSTHPYSLLIFPSAYAETITLNSTTLYNLTFAAISGGASVGQGTSITGLTSTSNNTQLSNVIINGIAINGNVNLTGNVNGTNFASTQVLFNNCQFNNSGGTIVLNNINNVNFYNCQIQGGSSVSTFTNVAFAYLEGAEGFINGTTLNLVDNPGGNVPAQYTGNYLLFSETKFYGTVTIDAGSELDSLLSYFGSGSVVTNSGTIHSWQTGWNGTLTGNNGSTTRVQGDVFLNAPTVNAGATFTNRGIATLASASLGAGAVSATNAVLSMKDGHVKSAQTTAPTTTINGNAGSGSSSSVSHATDVAGSLSLTTGTASWVAGVQTTINFNKAYNVAPIVSLTPSGVTAANSAVVRGVYVSSSTSSFTLNFATADVAQTTYTWNYNIMETQ